MSPFVMITKFPGRMYGEHCKNDAVDNFIETIGNQYKEKVGHDAEFYVVDIGDGARKLA